MSEPRRIVLDTNVWVSRLLGPGSVAGRAASHAVRNDRVLVSDATLAELMEVLARPKFAPYVQERERKEFVGLVLRIAERVPILRRVKACRDPKDDMLLELAISGEADVLVTGDQDLLTLHPFEGVPILSPRAYLDGSAE